MTRFGAPKLAFNILLTNSVSDLMRSSGTQTQLAGDPHKSSPQSVAASTQRFFRKPATTFRTSPASSTLTLTGNDLAIMLNKDTCGP